MSLLTFIVNYVIVVVKIIKLIRYCVADMRGIPGPVPKSRDLYIPVPVPTLKTNSGISRSLAKSRDRDQRTSGKRSGLPSDFENPIKRHLYLIFINKFFQNSHRFGPPHEKVCNNHVDIYPKL